MTRPQGLEERGRFVYKFVADDGERRKDTKWLTCLKLSLTFPV